MERLISKKLKKMFNNIVDNINTAHKSKATKNQARMLRIFKKLLEIKTDNKTDLKLTIKKMII